MNYDEKNLKTTSRRLQNIQINHSLCIKESRLNNNKDRIKRTRVRVITHRFHFYGVRQHSVPLEYYYSLYSLNTCSNFHSTIFISTKCIRKCEVSVS